MNERCSTLLLNKLSPKEKDPGSFTIPCDIGNLHINNSLADLEASISRMPYSMYEKLGLDEPKPTRMSLELADTSIQYPRGIAENVLIKVDKFVLPIDFIILDMREDSKIPIILGRPFLVTARAMIDVFNKKITLRIGNQEVIFDVNQSIKKLPGEDNECYGIDELDQSIHLKAHELIEDDQTDSANDIDEKNFELKDLPSHLEYTYLNGYETHPVIISSKLTEKEKVSFLQVLEKHEGAITWKMLAIKGISSSFYTHKTLMEEKFKPVIQPQRLLNPKDQDVVKNEIVRLLNSGLIYPILDSPWVSPIHVVPKKGGITVVLNDNNELIPSRTVTEWRVCIDYRKLNDATRKDQFPLPFIDQMMPFGLCNAPTTFQRCMTAIFHDMVEDFMEVFMDDFSVFGNSVSQCLSNLDKMLARCKETNLVLNWEKCHFMVKEGIVLGHKISGKGIEVDKAKIDVIAKLPYLTNVKGVRSFLGNAGFYRRFIKDFSMISKPMTQLLMKDVKFDSSDNWKKAFNNLKEKLTTAPIIISPDWNVPFKLTCDTSDFAVGAVLGQRIDGKFKPIYYASKTLNDAHAHYTTTEKELFAVEIADEFLDEHLMVLKTTPNDDEPWYADYVNYIVGKVILPKWTAVKRKRFFSQVKYYFWDVPYAFRLCPDNIMRRCVAGNEILKILAHCHSGPTGGHHSASIIGRKVYESGFFWPSIFKDVKDYVAKCDAC
ncbi:DNA-directed DNA polymerase [Tanacetum coccineum]